MAIVDMRTSDTYYFGGEIGFDVELWSTSGAYAWSGEGTQGNDVYLYGAGIASSGGEPASGTIDEILRRPGR